MQDKAPEDDDDDLTLHVDGSIEVNARIHQGDIDMKNGLWARDVAEAHETDSPFSMNPEQVNLQDRLRAWSNFFV